MQDKIVLNILSHLYGYKKVQILKYLVENSDENRLFCGTIKDICEANNTSKPTVVSLLNDMKNIYLIKKEKNGLYRLSEKVFN